MREITGHNFTTEIAEPLAGPKHRVNISCLDGHLSAALDAVAVGAQRLQVRHRVVHRPGPRYDVVHVVHFWEKLPAPRAPPVALRAHPSHNTP